MGRIILAGIIGGIVMFVWSFVVHMLLPLGEMGMKMLPNEMTVIATMQQSLTEPGLYVFPGMDMSKEMTDAEWEAWCKRHETGPAGMLVYHPIGGKVMQPRHFIVEGVADILAAILGAAILAMMACSYGGRVAAALGMGVIAWLTVNVSYWNWWGFPIEYVGGEATDIIVGWLLAGLFMAPIVRGVRRAAA